MSPGGGELSLSVCPGVGNRTSSTQMPGGVPGGEMVTGRIEPRIRADVCKYQPEVCNSEKFKILKKIHNIAHGKLLQEIHVLLRSDNYF